MEETKHNRDNRYSQLKKQRATESMQGILLKPIYKKKLWGHAQK